MKVSDIQVTAIHPERWGDDLDVVNAARVSFSKESEWNYPDDDPDANPVLQQRDVKLIHYLAKHKHFSPFNHSFCSFRVKAPLFVARQLVKHKFLPWNEVSRRYVDEEPEFYFPATWGKRVENVKQGASDERFVDDVIGRHEVKRMLQLYEHALRTGMAPEDARMFLPQNMMTEWWWSGTLGAFCDMLVLRLDPHTQYESRIVAEKIRDLIVPIFPVSLKARLENT
jgi:thymidylate synthase (FAD)